MASADDSKFFIPRSVNKKAGVRSVHPTVSRRAPSTSVTVGATREIESTNHGLHEKAEILKEKNIHSEDLAALICLALSDYSLWSDVELRKRMDFARDDDPEVVSEDGNDHMAEIDGRGYVSLAYLLAHSLVFRSPITTHSISLAHQPQSAFVKAIRSHAAGFVDVRLLVSPNTSQNQTGYQIRRKDWVAIRDATTASSSRLLYGKADWDNLTIYAENIPVQHRSTHGVLKFIHGLLLSNSSSSLDSIQHVFFPPHRQDRPGSVATCKGFALITLSSSDDVQHLLQAWPWNFSHPEAQKPDNEQTDALSREARRFSFRTIEKRKWEELKAEYLLFRQQLISEINDHQEDDDMADLTKPESDNPGNSAGTVAEVASSSTPVLETTTHPEIHSNSPYPLGCLIFARNIHPSTNKTTLRSLFSKLWRERGGDTLSDFINYLDYTKGMDVCYLRLSAPQYAEQMLTYFASHQTVQSSGLDEEGLHIDDAPEGSKAIAITVVRGKPEEVYWDKVPEKIRRQAVTKALSLLNPTPNEGFTPNRHQKRRLENDPQIQEKNNHKRRKK